MEISFDKEQYKDLLKTTHITTSILGILGYYFPDDFKEQSGKIDSLQNHILKHAKDFDCSNMVEDYKGKIILEEEEYNKMDKIVDEYDDFTFWEELETRLGHRDLAKELTQAEKERLKQDTKFMVEKTEEYFQKYRDEFEKNGIERLEIKNIFKKFK